MQKLLGENEELQNKNHSGPGAIYAQYWCFNKTMDMSVFNRRRKEKSTHKFDIPASVENAKRMLKAKTIFVALSIFHSEDCKCSLESQSGEEEKVGNSEL